MESIGNVMNIYDWLKSPESAPKLRRFAKIMYRTMEWNLKEELSDLSCADKKKEFEDKIDAITAKFYIFMLSTDKIEKISELEKITVSESDHFPSLLGTMFEQFCMDELRGNNEFAAFSHAYEVNLSRNAKTGVNGIKYKDGFFTFSIKIDVPRLNLANRKNMEMYLHVMSEKSLVPPPRSEIAKHHFKLKFAHLFYDICCHAFNGEYFIPLNELIHFYYYCYPRLKIVSEKNAVSRGNESEDGYYVREIVIKSDQTDCLGSYERQKPTQSFTMEYEDTLSKSANDANDCVKNDRAFKIMVAHLTVSEILDPKKIAEVMDITEARVSQIKKEGLKILEKMLSDTTIEDAHVYLSELIEQIKVNHTDSNISDLLRIIK